MLTTHFFTRLKPRRSRAILWLAAWLLLAGSPLLGRAATAVASFEPARPRAGETFRMVIESSEGTPMCRTLPGVAGLTWNTRYNKTQQSRVNGVWRYWRELTLVADKEGTYTIPAFSITIEGEAVIVTPPPLTVEPALTKPANAVASTGADSDRELQEGVFMAVRYGESEVPPESLYAGQELTITLQLFVQADADDFRLSENFERPETIFPTVEIEGASLRMQEDPNQEWDKRFRLSRTRVGLGGKTFTVYEYVFGLQPQVTGTLKGTITHSVPLVQSSGRRGPFGNFTLERKERKMEVDLSAIEIKPLPTPPATKDAHTYTLDLVGNWEVQTYLDKKRVKLGEDVTLTLRATGYGNVDAATPPSLTLHGFNVYPPEVKRVAGPPSTLEVKWVMVPRRVDAELPPLSFRVFDAGEGAWVTHRFDSQLVLEGNPNLTQGQDGGAPTMVSPSTVQQPDQREPRPDASIHYLKPVAALPPPTPGSGALRWAMGLFALGPLALGALVWMARRQEDEGGMDPARRRREALGRKVALQKRLQAASPEALTGIVRQELAPLLADLYGLPVGATLSELAEATTDPELAALLRQAEAAAYMPTGETLATPAQVATMVGRLGVWLLATWLLAATLVGPAAPSARAAEAAGALGSGAVAGADDAAPASAATAYDAGDFETARERYTALAAARPQDAAVWYNLGNAVFNLDHNAQAVACYERARRLAPRDADIRANLDFVRSRLSLPPSSPSDNPLQALRTLRDHLLPREWLLLASCGWSVLLVGLGLCRWRRGRFWHPALLAPALFFLLAITARQTQLADTWRGDQGMVTASNARLQPRPGANGATTGSFVEAGEAVTLQEQRENGWVRVRVGDAEGWLPTDKVATIWP